MDTLRNVVFLIYIVCSLSRAWGMTWYVELTSCGRVEGRLRREAL